MQTTEEETKESKLIRFVRRITENVDFPNIDNLAKVVDPNPNLFENMIGVVSAAYHLGERGLELQPGVYSYLPGLNSEELKPFLEGVHKQGRTKSGRLKTYPS